MTQTGQKRSPCPVACTLDLIGDKWTLLVVRDMLFGKCYFKDFSQSPEKIASNILADRLARLVEHGIAEKWTPSESTSREAYRLTARGLALEGVLDSIAQWGLHNIEGTEARIKAVRG